MFEVPNRLDWCWFCDMTCLFVYDEYRDNWCCTRCGRDLAHWDRKLVDGPWEERGGLLDNGVLKSYQRKHSRFVVELPFGYSYIGREEEHRGIAANVSEGGLLVYLHELIPKGMILKVAIFSAKGLECHTINGMASVVWADLPAKIDRGKYRYGLKFESFNRESLRNFNNLLREVARNRAGQQ